MKKNKGKLGNDAGNDALIKSLKELIKDDKQTTMNKKKITTPTPRLKKENIKDIKFDNDIKKAMEDDDDDSSKKDVVMSNTDYYLLRDKGTGTVIFKTDAKLAVEFENINGRVLKDINYIVTIILQETEDKKLKVLEQYISENPHLEKYVDDIKLQSGITLVDDIIVNDVDYDDLLRLKEHIFDYFGDRELDEIRKKIMKKTIQHSDWFVAKRAILFYYFQEFLKKRYNIQFSENVTIPIEGKTYPTKDYIMNLFHLNEAKSSKYNEFEYIEFTEAEEEKDKKDVDIMISKNLTVPASRNSPLEKPSSNLTQTKANFLSLKNVLLGGIAVVGGIAAAGYAGFPFILDGASFGSVKKTLEEQKKGAIKDSDKNPIIIGTQTMYKNRRYQSGELILLLKFCDKWLNEWLQNIEEELGSPIPFVKEDTLVPFFTQDFEKEREKQKLIKEISEMDVSDNIKNYYINKLNNWCQDDVQKEIVKIKEINTFVKNNNTGTVLDAAQLNAEKARLTTIVNDTLTLSERELKDAIISKIDDVQVNPPPSTPITIDGGLTDYKTSSSYLAAKKDFMNGKLSRDGFKKKKYEIKKEILNRK